MPEFAVELRNVSKRFPGPSGEIVTAVNNVTMQIRDGEFFSMLGPSGCGKTTSLRMIAGFELPTAGEIYIHDRAMGHTPPYKRPVNTVFQNYALFPHMTIGQNVGFGLEMKGVDPKEIQRRSSEALEMVRLAGFEKRTSRQLSGGQQQRVALARALVNHPEVLRSTSRSARSTSSSARRCSSNSSACSAKSASRSCSSRTTRKKP